LLKIGSPDLHLHHRVSAVKIAAHLGAQRVKIFPRIIVAACGVYEDARIRLGAVAFSEQAEQRFAGNFRDRIPHRHIDGADGDGAFAMAARLLVAHHRLPDPIGVQIVAGIVQQGPRFRLQHARREALANEASLSIAAVGVESIADYGSSLAYNVGDHGNQRAGHLRKVDISVGDGRSDGRGDFTQIGYTHAMQILLEWYLYREQPSSCL
jgi:hypothetical protein